MNRKSLVLKGAWLLAALVLVGSVFLPAAPARADAGSDVDVQPTEAVDAVAGFDVKFAGVIETVPPAIDAHLGKWKVAGQEVLATSRTRIRLTTGKAEPGMWADVTAVRAPDGVLTAESIVVMPPEVRLKGPVTSKPATPEGVGPWTIGGQTVQVTVDTRIGDRGGPIDVGDWAEVFALEKPAGILTALRMRGVEKQPEIEAFGAIQKLGAGRWLLSSIPISLTAATLVHGAPQVGLLAQVAATAEPEPDGALAAKRIKVSWQEPERERDRGPVAFDGVVKALPPSILNGLWTVYDGTKDRKVLVTPFTAIDQEKGLVVLGAKVHVVGWQAQDTVMAMRITVLESPAPGGQFVRFTGPIQALPPSGLIGEWKVAGRTVKVTAATRIEGASRVRVGALAEVAGIQAENGTVMATWIRIGATPGPRP